MCIHIDPRQCARAANACDAILSRYLHVEVEKAAPLNPLDPRDFMVISKKIAGRCKLVSHEAQAVVVRRTIDTLDVDWANITSAERQRIVVAARMAIKRSAPRTSAAVMASLKADSTPLVKRTKQAAINEFNLSIRGSFTAFDERVSHYAWHSQGNFVTQFYEGRADMFSAQARSVVAWGLERGLGRSEIVRELRGRLLDGINKSDAYLEVIAATFANRARSFAQIGAFAEAGIQAYRWESVLDEVTTETCRFLHGKVFSTGDALNQFERIESAAGDDPDEQKTLSPWVREGKDENGQRILFTKPTADSPRTVIAQVDRSGVGRVDTVGSYSRGMDSKQLTDNGISMPPIHGLCRSTVLPEDSLGSASRPSPRTVGAPPPPPPAPKIPKPAKPKPPPASLGQPPPGTREFSRGFSEDLELSERFDQYTAEGIEARSRIRERLRSHLTGYGMQTKTDYPMYASAFDDVGKKPVQRPTASYLIHKDDLTGYARGYMDPRDASIHIHDEQWDGAKRAMRRHGKNPRAFAQGLRRAQPGPTWYYNEIANDVRTFFHEEAHGMSAMLNGAYDGIGVGMEEATNEIAARRATRDFFGVKADELHVRSPLRPPTKRSLGYWDTTGSYGQEVRRLFAAYERASGIPVRTEADLARVTQRIEDASISMKTRPAWGEDARRSYKPRDIVDDFVSQPALELTEPQRAKLRSDLMSNALQDPLDDWEFGIIEE